MLYLYAIWSKDHDEKPFKNVAYPLVTSPDVLFSIANGLRSYILAYFCIYYIYGENQYPAFTDDAKEFKLFWMIPILVRDLVATMMICGLWDWILYFSPFKVNT